MRCRGGLFSAVGNLNSKECVLQRAPTKGEDPQDHFLRDESRRDTGECSSSRAYVGRTAFECTPPLHDGVLCHSSLHCYTSSLNFTRRGVPVMTSSTCAIVRAAVGCVKYAIRGGQPVGWFDVGASISCRPYGVSTSTRNVSVCAPVRCCQVLFRVSCRTTGARGHLSLPLSYRALGAEHHLCFSQQQAKTGCITLECRCIRWPRSLVGCCATTERGRRSRYA